MRRFRSTGGAYAGGARRPHERGTYQKNKESNQIDLFGLGATSAPGFAGASNGGHHDVYPVVEDWSPAQQLVHEKESLGFYITGHPLDKYEGRLSRLTSGSIAELREQPVSGEVRAGGVATAMRLRNTKKGERYASFQLEDKTGFIEVIVWPDTYRRCMEILSSDDPILVSGKMDVGEERVQIIANGVIPLEQASQKLAPPAGPERRKQEASARIHFYLLGGGFTPEGAAGFHETLRKYPGKLPVFLHLAQADNSEAIIEPENEGRLRPELLQTIEQLFGSRVTVSPLPS